MKEAGQGEEACRGQSDQGCKRGGNRLGGVNKLMKWPGDWQGRYTSRFTISACCPGNLLGQPELGKLCTCLGLGFFSSQGLSLPPKRDMKSRTTVLRSLRPVQMALGLSNSTSPLSHPLIHSFPYTCHTHSSHSVSSIHPTFDILRHPTFHSPLPSFILSLLLLSGSYRAPSPPVTAWQKYQEA